MRGLVSSSTPNPTPDFDFFFFTSVCARWVYSQGCNPWESLTVLAKLSSPHFWSVAPRVSNSVRHIPQTCVYRQGLPQASWWRWHVSLRRAYNGFGVALLENICWVDYSGSWKEKHRLTILVVRGNILVVYPKLIRQLYPATVSLSANVLSNTENYIIVTIITLSVFFIYQWCQKI